MWNRNWAHGIFFLSVIIVVTSIVVFSSLEVMDYIHDKQHDHREQIND